ncbi:MAG: DedA family protein [Desulfuromonadaceae bacterium]|nr:DedA family protein [Desulfuromonadaceae bacterium]
MAEWLQQLFSLLPESGLYVLLIGLIAFCESLVGIGLIVPGSTLTVFAGFLALHGKGDIGSIMCVAALGSFCGDVVSYWLGARFGPYLVTSRLLRSRTTLYRKTELFFLEHGGKSIFFGRFIGPIRGFTPFVAGGARMRPGSFLAWTAVSVVLWGLAYPGLGYAAGASWKNVQDWTGRLTIFIGMAVVITVLWIWGRRKIR